MRDDLTRRYAPLAFELRAEQTTATLEGYASTFAQPYDMGLFREEVRAGAFSRTLGMDPDVRFLVDHEGTPLARTKSGTLTLAEDSTGLHMRAELDLSNPTAQGIASAVRRGDMDAMSFAFRVAKGGDTWNDDYTHRTLVDLSLHDGDVSVVTHPANPATSIGLRSMSNAAAELVYAMTLEVRAGKVLSAANVAHLRSALDALEAADGSVDHAAAELAAVLDVAVPDDDKPRSGRPTDLARRQLALLGL